ncbi:hypothetical protein [Spirosoma sp. 48-14]|uniref:hypothetical protein n=1 Tax=Spirosoma sp. 48-14 TaxID=1895854 RepID=UPI0009602A09|nr:hypothetical protein [Spirosoma sp. 48-14]OJW78447.1 MAG: hypothetical protein BGO59_31075 [Spirosoma sp. 48-14]
MKKYLYLVGLSILFLPSCSTNHEPPEYIESIALQKAGTDGIKILTTFASKADKRIASSGVYNLKIHGYEQNHEPIQIYDTTYSINISDFREYSELNKDSTGVCYTTKYLDHKDFKNTDKVASKIVFVTIGFKPKGSKGVITGSKKFELD